MQVADRITGSDRTRTFVAKKEVKRTLLEIRRIGNTEEWGEVVPVILEKRYSRVAAHELLSSNRSGYSGGSRRMEKISKSRYPEKIAVFGLDRKTVWNSRYAHPIPSDAITQSKVTLHPPLVLCKERQVLF